MAWEDRSPAEQAQADQEAAAYRDSDDDKTYRVTTAKGTRLIVQGINSARDVAGQDGSITEQQD
jgi:hypothetical protein